MTAKKGARTAIRDAVGQAETIPPQSAGDTRGSDAPAGEAPSIRTSGGILEMRPNGLFKISEGAPLPVSGPFEVMSQTRDDESSAWGLMLRFRDFDGALQHMVIRRDLFAGDGGDLRNQLARRGLYVNPSHGTRGLLAEYLSRVSTDRRARIVTRTGWHRIDGVPVFVLPDRTFGTPSVEVVYQPAIHDASLFNAMGTVADWQASVAARCVGNSRLLLAVSAAFAGPLLEGAGEEGGGLHFRGASRVGKTTALRVAASVWGGSPGSGAAGYIRQWRATDNAMEGLALAQSDTLLPLDELGQADARGVGDTAYLLASGQGKARSDRAGGLRAPARFRVLFLSTGELSLGDKIAEGGPGRRVKAGQEVRLVDIPADAGKGLGLFEELHGTADAETFIQSLRAGTTRAYGSAAVAFLEYLVAKAAEPGFADDNRDWMQRLVTKWIRPYPDAGGQVRSVARRFALVAVAGERATQAGITGWDHDIATGAAYTCFKDWLKERGTRGAHEDAQAVAQLRDFLTRHGDSRFHEWRHSEQNEPQGQGQQSQEQPTKESRIEKPQTDQEKWEKRRLKIEEAEIDPSPPPPSPATEHFRTVARAGWRRRKPDSLKSPDVWHYYLTVEATKEVFTGLDRRQAIRFLVDQGFILAGADNKAARSLCPPGYGKMRLYHVLPKIFDAGEDIIEGTEVN